jgi:hypothetical protein
MGRGLLAGLAAGLLAGCAVLPPPEGGATACWPAFPYSEGWLGGDAAYSIPLSADETIWLFGDTFVGGPTSTDRRGSAFVHNSIAVSRCHADGRWEIDYAWGRGPDGAPRAFLDRGEEGAWWWLFDGFVHDGRLYLGLLEVQRAPPSGPLALPFAFTGVHLARVADPHRAPEDWRPEVVRLSDAPDALPAAAMVVDGPYVYLFTFLDGGDGRHPRGLARLPLRALDGATRDVSGALEFLAEDGSWQPGLDPARARVLMDDTASEMSVRHHPELGRWLAVYSYPVDPPDAAPSDAVWIRTAERPEGPWSERRLLFRVPELHPSWLGGFDEAAGCYAAKEHPQLAREGRLVLTYVCNLFARPGEAPGPVLRRLLVDMDLYRPVPVAIEPPPALGAEP